MKALGTDPVEEIVGLSGATCTCCATRQRPLVRDEASGARSSCPTGRTCRRRARARAQVTARALRDPRTLELGCGLGLPSIAAALAGGRVLATDWSPDAVEAAAHDARRNGVDIEVAVVPWQQPREIIERAPWTS